MTEQLINLALAAAMIGIMSSLGMSLKVEDFRAVLRRPVLLFIAFLTFSFVLPSVAFLLGFLLTNSATVALGLVLVAACPGGTLSNAFTSYAKGDVALSISLTLVISLLSVMTLPIVSLVGVKIFLNESVQVNVPVMETMLRIVSLTAIPVAIGMYVNAAVPHISRVIRNPLKNTASLSLSGIFILYIFVEKSDLGDDLFNSAFLVVALNAISIMIGFGFAVLMRLPASSRIAYVMEHSIKQEGLGLYIATAVLALPAVAVPLLVNSFIGSVVGLVLVIVSRFWSFGSNNQVHGRTVPLN
ncbi:MAG: bile acid:sodium symporter [Pseudomonadota bacterium]